MRSKDDSSGSLTVCLSAVTALYYESRAIKTRPDQSDRFGKKSNKEVIVALFSLQFSVCPLVIVIPFLPVAFDLSSERPQNRKRFHRIMVKSEL
jgi:hypothetical protein